MRILSMHRNRFSGVLKGHGKIIRDRQRERKETGIAEKKYYWINKHVRLTKADDLLLKEKAKQAGMSDSAYIRFLISQKPGDHVQIRKLLKDLISEVNYIGHNINQIVKSYHEHFYRKEDKTRLFAYMRKLLETVNEAVDTIGNQ